MIKQDKTSARQKKSVCYQGNRRIGSGGSPLSVVNTLDLSLDSEAEKYRLPQN
jgi:hypothetical protein